MKPSDEHEMASYGPSLRASCSPLPRIERQPPGNPGAIQSSSLSLSDPFRASP